MAIQGYILSEQAVRDLTELSRLVKSLGGPQALRDAARRDEAPAPPYRRAKIVAAEATVVVDANANPVQWKYKIQEIVKTTAGYAGWVTMTKGYVSSTFDSYNHAETGNDGTGRQMNGIDHDGADYPATFKMQPMQVGAVVLFEYVQVNSALTEIWFWPPGYNGEDGTCA